MSSFSCEREPFTICGSVNAVGPSNMSNVTLERGTLTFDGAGVGVRVVGPEAVVTAERLVLKVPYLLASAARGERPVDGAVASVGSNRLASVGASSSVVCTGI